MLATQKLGELQTALKALSQKRAEVAAESKTEKKTSRKHPLETLQQAAQTLEEARARPDFTTRINVYWDAFMDDLEDKVLGSEEQSKALLDTYGRRLRTVLGVVDDIDKAIKHDFDVEGNCVEPVNSKTLGVTMASVKGLEPVKKKLEQQFVLPINYPGLFGAARGGILFYGPPGNGKSLIAKATAAELGGDTMFYAIDPGQIKSQWEGGTEKNITRVFRCADRAVKASGARESKTSTSGARRAILFFDEADALFGSRGSGGDVNASNVRSVNSFLQAMDGIKATPTVTVMAATNLLSSIDAAILRRLTTRILIDNPDYEARVGLIKATLAQYYNFPAYVARLPKDMNPEERAAMLERRALHNIRVYGSCVTVTKGRVFTSEEVEAQYVSEKDISDLALKLGPNKSGAAEMGRRPSPRKQTSTDGHPEFSAEGKSKYGYSGADIGIIVGDAIREAAGRAILPGARYVWVDVPTSSGGKRTSTSKKGDVARYAVYVPGTGRCPLPTSRRRGEGKEEELEDEDTEEAGEMSIDDVPHKKDVMSFDLRVSDLNTALLDYGLPPTQEKAYLEYVAQPAS